MIRRFCFRAHVSAAPLKRQFRDRCTCRNHSFPRSRERGPVEAPSRDAPRDQFVRFRAHVSAAPLKLGSKRLSYHSSCLFPRSRERGPVEAARRHQVPERRHPVSALT